MGAEKTSKVVPEALGVDEVDRSQKMEKDDEKYLKKRSGGLSAGLNTIAIDVGASTEID